MSGKPTSTDGFTYSHLGDSTLDACTSNETKDIIKKPHMAKIKFFISFLVYKIRQWKGRNTTLSLLDT
jgi:hypothetical protein